jgi:hypothetical protein
MKRERNGEMKANGNIENNGNVENRMAASNGQPNLIIISQLKMK